MGVAGFIFGAMAGQMSGSWVYVRLAKKVAGKSTSDWLAASAAGVVTTIVATALYIPFGVHVWLGGIGSPWGVSAFMGLCVGLCQGVLLKGRPWQSISHVGRFK